MKIGWVSGAKIWRKKCQCQVFLWFLVSFPYDFDVYRDKDFFKLKKTLEKPMYFEKMKNINVNEKCGGSAGVSWKWDGKNSYFMWCWGFLLKNIRNFLRFVQKKNFTKKTLKKTKIRKRFTPLRCISTRKKHFLEKNVKSQIILSIKRIRK